LVTRGPRPQLLRNVLRQGLSHTSREAQRATLRLLLQQLSMLYQQKNPKLLRNLQLCLARETAPPIQMPCHVRGLIGVRSASALSVVVKKRKTMSLFVSRFGPQVTAQDIKSSLEDPLKLTSLCCTRLETKFNSYASFHFSVNEDFPLINNTGVWPNGCLIAPFYGRLNADQIYRPDDPLAPYICYIVL
jgi:hypothetical protein